MVFHTKIKILISSLLFFYCSEDGVNVIQSSNSPNPAVDEKTVITPEESPVAHAEQSTESSVSEKPVATPLASLNITNIHSNDNSSGDNTQSCLTDTDIYSFYWPWVLAATLAGGQKTTEDCKNLQYDKNGSTILKIKLRGDCSLDIEYSANNSNLDTTFNVCN